MSFRRFIALFVLFTAPASARQSIGTFATWASFCDQPRKCFAVAAPVEQRGDPYLIVYPVGSSLIVRAHVGRAVRDARIRVEGTIFMLTVAGSEAVADTSTSGRIVKAIRQGEALTVIARSVRGARIRHHYALAGAPSAIDAAAIAAHQ